MEEAVAEPPGLPMLGFTDQAEALEEGDQGLGCEYQFQPDLIGPPLMEGEAPQVGVHAAANPVLDPGVSAVANFEGNDVGVLLVGDQCLEAKPLVVSEGELGARVGKLAAADGPGPRWPGCQVEVAQLTDGLALSDLAVLADRRPPGVLRHGQDRLPHRLGESKLIEKWISSSRRASVKSCVAPPESARASISIPQAWSGSCTSAASSTPMWSAAVLAPALPARGIPASASPLASR
jgi:hypothetical protein